MSVKTWSDEQEEALIRMYTKEGIKDINHLALHFRKGYRSVISKLVQLRIYEKPSDRADNKAHTVKVMLRDIERILGIYIEGDNLNKKENMIKLVTALKEKLDA
jgi:hypothetical protein